MALRYAPWTAISRATVGATRATPSDLPMWSSHARFSLESFVSMTKLPETTSNHLIMSSRCFSSESSSGIMGKIRETWDDRNKKSQQEKFAKSMEKMANAEKWTLNDFNEELKETLGGWRSKLPGVSGLSQTKMAKQTQEIVESIMSQVGPGATAEDLQNLSRHEKLKISIKSGASLQELNLLAKQFQGMDIMQQVLRKRKLDGKPLPTDEAGMKAAVQQDGQKVLSKGQRKEIMKARQRKRF